jgi:homoserine kinase type II
MKRMAAHQQGVAAKYTRSRRPVNLMATSDKMSRSEAMRLEIKVKRLPKEKKLAEVEKHEAKKPVSRIRSSGKNYLFSRNHLKSVSALWRVPLKKVHWKSPVQGSPERSVFRVVVEDANGNLFVLEEISEKLIDNKKRIAAILDFLTKKKLTQIQAYLAAENGKHILRGGNNFWQMTPFIRGADLNREQHMYEKWRGSAMADFLIALRRKTKSMPSGNAGAIFSLKAYMFKLIREINLYNKDIKDEIQNIAGFLEKDFISAYEKLPLAFCHGDYHPLNIIWSEDDIRCVIDWEFCGLKSELYDAANLIGCVGVEDPRSLTGDLVISFIADIRKARVISPQSWKYLLEFVVALRFAWMSEWLRLKDTDMIRLELDYMRLLIDNKIALQNAWLR